MHPSTLNAVAVMKKVMQMSGHVVPIDVSKAIDAIAPPLEQISRQAIESFAPLIVQLKQLGGPWAKRGDEFLQKLWKEFKERIGSDLAKALERIGLEITNTAIKALVESLVNALYVTSLAGLITTGSLLTRPIATACPGAREPAHRRRHGRLLRRRAQLRAASARPPPSGSTPARC